MQVPKYQPHVLKSVKDLPADAEAVLTEAGGLPEYLVYNQNAHTFYRTKGNTNQWPPELLSQFNWRLDSSSAYDGEVFIPIDYYQSYLFTGYAPKANTNPQGFAGWQRQKHIKEICPKFVIWKKADLLETPKNTPRKHTFFGNVHQATLPWEDPRIKIASVSNSQVWFDVEGDLTTKEWEKLGRYPKHNVTANAYPLAQTCATCGNGITLLPELLDEATPYYGWDPVKKTYAITPYEIKNLLPTSQKRLGAPVKHCEKFETSARVYRSEHYITFEQSDLYGSDLRASKGIWEATRYKVLIEPAHITQFPSTPVACQFRSRQGLISQALQLDPQTQARANVKNNADASIFIYEKNGKAAFQGFLQKNVKDGRVAKLQLLKDTFGNDFETKFESVIGKVTDFSDQMLDAYYAAALRIQQGDYVKLPAWNTCLQWLRNALPHHPAHLFNIFTQEEIHSAFSQYSPKAAFEVGLSLLACGKLTQAEEEEWEAKAKTPYERDMVQAVRAYRVQLQNAPL